MAVPTGAELEIYRSKVKGAGQVRAKIRLNKPIADADFTDEFSGSALDTTLWSSVQPANTSIAVTGGALVLSSTANANGFPVVQSRPGRFPEDLTIGWTLDWSMAFPSITGFGSFFRVGDLQNAEAIVAVKCNTANGMQVLMPDTPSGTLRYDSGQDTSSHNYSLVYTPGSPGQYEVFVDSVSKGTMASTDRQAWQIVIGNGSVQTNLGVWTTISVSRVDLDITTPETQSYPTWATNPVTDGDGVVWDWLPNITTLDNSTHKRNDLDTATIELPTDAYIAGTGYLQNIYAGYDWNNREIRIESRQSDGAGNYTSWKEVFRGECDEPPETGGEGATAVTLTIREKVRRHLQMYHAVRGYSDNGTPIDGLVMNLTWTGMIKDACNITGLTASEYNVASDPLKPRSQNMLGDAVLGFVSKLADEGAMAVWRNASQANPGRMEVQEWFWGTDTPAFTFDIDTDIVALDHTESTLGMAAQVVITVQHSEFGEFSDVYPHAPVPPTGAVIRKNVSIAQSATDINTTRLLPFLHWKVANRELNALALMLIGQDWLEHDIEMAVADNGKFGIAGDCWVVDGWNYKWSAAEGWRTTVQLVNQHPEQTIFRASLDRRLHTAFMATLVPSATQAVTVTESVAAAVTGIPPAIGASAADIATTSEGRAAAITTLFAEGVETATVTEEEETSWPEAGLLSAAAEDTATVSESESAAASDLLAEATETATVTEASAAQLPLDDLNAEATDSTTVTETASGGIATAGRVTQIVAQVLGTGNPAGRVTQIVVQILGGYTIPLATAAETATVSESASAAVV